MSVVPPGAAGTTMRPPWLGFHGPSAARSRGNRLATGRMVAAASAARRKPGVNGFPRRSLNIVEGSRNTRALANPPHFPYQFVVRLPPIPLISDGVRAKEDILKRRTFVSGSAALAAAGFASTTASAASIKPYSWDLNPPTDTRENFIAWGKARGEDPVFLGQRWDRFQALVRNKDIWGQATIRAFLLTPREEFSAINPAIHKRAYEHAFLDIGYGVTMSGPHVQGRMTNVIDVKRGEKVLEIGTGSGVQSAYIANLTENAYTIEIIAPLAARTRGLYDKLIEKGYTEFKHIKTKAADGYYGWEEAAPFDKIIVTCGIDHVPPPLLQQLKSGGLMVIPVGPPGAQRVLKVTKTQGADGSITTSREDIYGGKIVPFVPFTKMEGDKIVGTHNR
jgi:protein-L-isoaspartate(D-aspartate) O-methyltransferase